MKYKVKVSRYFEFTTELEIEANSKYEADEAALKSAGQATMADCKLAWDADRNNSYIIRTIEMGSDEDEDEIEDDEE